MDLIEAAGAEVTFSPRTLSRAYRELSDRYRGGAALDGLHLTQDQVLAYLAARMPATLAVARAVLAEVAERRPRWRPASVLDLGAGPGTAAWAAVETFSSVTRAELIERSSAMIQLGRRLAGRAAESALRDADWQLDSVLSAPLTASDLVIASYLLGEVARPDGARAVARWWQATRGELIVIEPGTPAGFGTILQARAELIAAGATVTAPCPSDAACPMRDRDWCHFGERVNRTRLHRAVKEADLGYEDENYAYVVASRQDPVHAPARVLRVPQARGGHVRLTLCEAPSIRDAVVSRSQEGAYRWARRARWGDAVPPGVSGGPQSQV